MATVVPVQQKLHIVALIHNISCSKLVSYWEDIFWNFSSVGTRPKHEHFWHFRDRNHLEGTTKTPLMALQQHSVLLSSAEGFLFLSLLNVCHLCTFQFILPAWTLFTLLLCVFVGSSYSEFCCTGFIWWKTEAYNCVNSVKASIKTRMVKIRMISVFQVNSHTNDMSLIFCSEKPLLCLMALIFCQAIWTSNRLLKHLVLHLTLYI